MLSVATAAAVTTQPPPRMPSAVPTTRPMGKARRRGNPYRASHVSRTDASRVREGLVHRATVTARDQVEMI